MIDVDKLEALRTAATGAQRLRVLATRAGSSTVAGLFEGALHEALALIGKAGQESPVIPPVPLVSVPSDPATRVHILAAIEAEADAVRIAAGRGGSDLSAFLIATATESRARVTLFPRGRGIEGRAVPAGALMPRPSGRDLPAKLRGLAGELGIDLVKMPNKDLWQIIDTHGTPLRNPKIDATGFRTKDAIAHMEKMLRGKR